MSIFLRSQDDLEEWMKMERIKYMEEYEGIMETIEWNVESDTFGKILGAVGPLDLDNLQDLEDYDYKPAITDWVADAVARKTMRKFNPTLCG